MLGGVNRLKLMYPMTGMALGISLENQQEKISMPKLGSRIENYDRELRSRTTIENYDQENPSKIMVRQERGDRSNLPDFGRNRRFFCQSK
ncbi:hypothetical protein AM228_12115 [Planktothricoides sp. SR001]|nr:hypothetical protein AM228_12115 [Planktothricoides sp. SR001]